ncbi:unnamed protein product [Amaranthus hypochondriacus]
MNFSIDRNHMFLICNGILVILVKSSSSKNKSSSNSGYSAHRNYDQDFGRDYKQSNSTTQFYDGRSVESEVEVHDHVYVDHDVDVDHDHDHNVDVKNVGLSIVKVNHSRVQSKVHIHHHHPTQCIPLIENYEQGLEWERQRQLIPIKKSATKRSLHARKVHNHDHDKLMNSKCNQVCDDDVHGHDVDDDDDHDVFDVKNVGLSIVKVNVTSVESKVHVHHHQLMNSKCDDDDGHDHDVDDEDAEELNKRCEDFIRRMKQGILSESRKDKYVITFS